MLLGHGSKPYRPLVASRRATVRGAHPCGARCRGGGLRRGIEASRRRSADGRFDAQRAFRDLRAQVRIGPRPAGSAASRQEVRLIARRLREAGVREVRVQHPHRNVVGSIPGEAPGTVVVGAHHDTKDIPGLRRRQRRRLCRRRPARVGARPARAPEGPSIQLVFFDAEEARGDRPFELDGARGKQPVRPLRASAAASRARRRWARSAPWSSSTWSATAPSGIPREENSDPDLYGLFSDAAQEQPPAPRPSWAKRPPILDDHLPFAAGGDPVRRPDRFRVRPGPPARRLLAHAPGQPRSRLRERAWTRWGRRRSPCCRGFAERTLYFAALIRAQSHAGPERSEPRSPPLGAQSEAGYP